MAAALLVLVLGIAAALTYHDGGATHTGGGVITSTAPETFAPSTSSTTTSSAATTTTTRGSSSTSTSTSVRGLPGTTTSVTVRAAVASPEAAANGLIAAYRNGDRTQAQRFATDAVVEVLFQQPYVPADDPGFQGCQPEGPDFLCTYLQPSVRYDMTVRRSDAGGFRVTDLDVQDT